MDPQTYLKPATAALLYQMLYDVQRILGHHGAECVVIAGTLLGAVRHGGIIPWDDDADVSVHWRDRAKVKRAVRYLERCGYELHDKFHGFSICSASRRRIPGYPWSWPFVDIFFHFERDDGRTVHMYKKVRKTWPNEYFLPGELYPLREAPFHGMTVKVPNKPRPYLSRAYGRDWATVGYRTYDHSKEEAVDEKETRKVKLTKRDLQPAQPSRRIVKRRCLPKET